MIASRSGSDPSAGVSLTARRYESVAAITILPGSKRTRIPVRTGRLSSRDAERPTRFTVSSSASPSIGCSSHALDLGQARKVLGRVRVDPIARSAAGDHDDGFIRLVLDRDVGVGQRTRDVEQQAARNDDLAFAAQVCVDWRSQRELHVGRGEMELAALGPKLDPAEHEHRRSRRDGAGDERQAVGEYVPRDGELQVLCPRLFLS